MKEVDYIDQNGYKRKRVVRDSVPDKEAHRGIPLEPPDLSLIDWDEIQRELHNRLIDRGLITMKDVRHLKTLQNAITSIIQPKVVALYKQQDQLEKEASDATKHPSS